MATILTQSSPSPHDDDHIPTATLALPSVASSSRRLPPPCWSPEETVALIEAYKNKWYSLRRGYLRANHWQDVADDVAARCPDSPPKTAVQCRHKMEKLRKRYRAEVQRAAAHGGVRRFTSSWVHFQNMYSMEKGPNPTPPSSDDDDDDDDADYNNSGRHVNDLYSYNQKGSFGGQLPESNGIRTKIPGRAAAEPPMAKVYSKFDEIGGPNPSNPNPRFANPSGFSGAAPIKVFRGGFAERGETRKRESELPKLNKTDDGLSELVAAIHALGEGYMRTDKAKMDMLQQVEEMRMEMELKRTEMILESERRIVDAFAQAISEKSVKRAKRNSPE